MLKIEIKTSGAAFTDENGEFDAYWGGEEIVRILENIADDIQYGYTSGFENDINGNRVCVWSLED